MTAVGKRMIRLDSRPVSPAFFTEEGYLIDKPVLTSTGIFEYENPDGSIRRELRLLEEVFDQKSLQFYKRLSENSPKVIIIYWIFTKKCKFHDNLCRITHKNKGNILVFGQPDGFMGEFHRIKSRFSPEREGKQNPESF